MISAAARMSDLAFSLGLFTVALVLALVLTPFVRRVALRFGALDYPDGLRKFHVTPLPKLGGIAIFAGFYLAISFLPLWGTPGALSAFDLARRSFVPSVLILLLGVADDLWTVRPSTKVIVQILAGAWICWYPDMRIAVVTNPIGPMPIDLFGPLSIPLTIAWILLVTNGFNIVDGMDGLASGVAFVATACLFLASLQRPDAFVPLLIAPLAGGLLGFLPYNFNPAKIFLGDSGSLWLGFMIGVLSIAGNYKSSTAIAMASPLLSLALPLIEVGSSTLRRFLRGQPIWQADSNHIHHQLLKRGFSARRAAILLYAGSGLFGAASLFLVDTSRIVIGVTTITLGVISWVGLQQLGYSEFTEVRHAFRRGFLYQRRIIQNSILARKLSDDLRAASSITEAWPLLIAVADHLRFRRIELIADQAWTAGPPQSAGPVFPAWTTTRQADADADEQRIISVHLVVDGCRVARVELCRFCSEEPLHSELPILLDVIAERLPRLLVASYKPAENMRGVAVGS